MFDKLVFWALTGSTPSKSNLPSRDILQRFKDILSKYNEELSVISNNFSKSLWPMESRLIPNVRILDNCIWFDWACEWNMDLQLTFGDWIDFHNGNNCYPAKQNISERASMR
jgi:hypothetical protein